MLAAMAACSVPLQLLRRFVAPLLLLMISVHALTPLGQPLQRVSGSAFSAETVEVSLRSGQRGSLVKQVEAPRVPAIDVDGAMPVPQPIVVPAFARSAPAPGLGPTGPPPAGRTSFSPLSPRAPPAA